MMSEHAIHQIIHDTDCMPVFTAVPYHEILSPIERRDWEVTAPHAVVKANILYDKKLFIACREHKNLSQKKVTDRMCISQQAA